MTSRAKPRFTSRRSRSQPTDQETTGTDTVIQKWAGDQLSRTTWFNVMDVAPGDKYAAAIEGLNPMTSFRA